MKDIDYWQNEVSFVKKNKNNNKVIKKNNIDLNKIEKNADIICNNNRYVDMVDVNRCINNHNTTVVKNRSFGIDNNTMRRLKTGKYNVDKTIDFHGKTLDEAFNILINEINKNYFLGLRCLLIITGKGLRSQDKNKTIKNEIDKWLNHYLIVDKILTYTDAIQKDGGSGAIYVLLRRNKLKNINESEY